jgi:hypothetical protein
MTGIARCPFCGALLNVAWAKAHAPTCRALPVAMPPITADVLAAVRQLRADVLSLRQFISPTDGNKP